MGRKKLDLTGQVFGRLTVLREVEPHISPNGENVRKWLCQCECGNTKKVRGSNLKNGNTTSCNCYHREKSTTHNNTHSKEYKTWISMKKRCLNANDKHYADYGGRGIKICPQWINSFETFLADVGKAPGPRYSIDRTDNNGNYEPTNVRWATAQVQSINKRMRSDNTSGVQGISWHKASNKYRARIMVNNKTIYLGYFTNKEDAIEARMKAEQQYHQPLLKTT